MGVIDAILIPAVIVIFILLFWLIKDNIDAERRLKKIEAVLHGSD